MKTLLVALLFAGSVLTQTAAQTPAQTSAQTPRVAPAQGPPPRNLVKRPDGRFTANEDPANPERFEVHVVQTGDTLSQIAGRYLMNFRLWPQLWEQNDHIINPHWIYPNDKILIKPITLITEAAPPEPMPTTPPPPPPPEPAFRPAPIRQPAPAAETPAPPPPPRTAAFRIDRPRPIPEVKTGDIMCSGFVQHAPLATDMKVIAKHNADGGALATESQYVYLGQGSEDGVTVGAKFQVIRPTKRLESQGPGNRDERTLGTHYLDIGQLQVVMTQPDFSLARVSYSCEAIELGDPLMAFQEFTVPAPPRPRQFNEFMTTTGDVKASVVITKGALSNFGSAFKTSSTIPGVRGGSMASLEKGVAAEGSIVYINAGAAQGVKVGDLFIVFKQLDVDTKLYDRVQRTSTLDRQRTAVAELVVLKVGERAATALVTYSVDSFSAGDPVERR